MERLMARCGSCAARLEPLAGDCEYLDGIECAE